MSFPKYFVIRFCRLDAPVGMGLAPGKKKFKKESEMEQLEE